MYEFLAWFQTHPMQWPDGLQSTLQKQSAAALEFRTYLNNANRRAFDKAWSYYAEPKGNDQWITRDKIEVRNMEKRIETLVAFTRKQSFWSF